MNTEATTPENTMSTYEITIARMPRRKDFNRCVESLKRAGAKFDPSSKTWSLVARDLDELHDMGVSGNTVSDIGEMVRRDEITVEEV